MKTKLFLIAAVMFLAFTVSAFPQSTYSVSQETIEKVACCGLAEPTGAVAFSAVALTPPSVTGTITLRYNLPIANLGSGATGVQVRAVDGGGVALGTQPTWTVSNGVDGKGIIVIAVPAGYVYPNTIRVSNVRVNVSGSCNTPTQAVDAHATSTGNLLTIGESDAIALVKAVEAGLAAPIVTGPFTISASSGTVTGTGTITVSEAFLTAFGITSTFPDLTRSQQTMIRLRVAGIPSGVTVTFPVSGGIFQRSTSAGALEATALPLTGPTSPQEVFYVLAAASNPAAIESLVVTPTITTVSPYPLAPSTITVTAALGPLTAGSTATLYPQYIEGCNTSAATLGTVTGVLNTILLVPYATTEAGYNTALSVANTTKDPGTTALMNFPGAIPQTGKLTIYFYPKNGATIDPWVSTSHPSSFGLDSAGKLPAGATFVALISQILPSTVTEFGGYIFIVTDFTNAHGEFFVSNFDNFTHGALMLVVSDLARVAAGRTQEQGLNN